MFAPALAFLQNYLINFYTKYFLTKDFFRKSFKILNFIVQPLAIFVALWGIGIDIHYRN
jgi:hypothetical protein